MGTGIITRERRVFSFFFMADGTFAYFLLQSVFHVLRPVPLLIFPVTLIVPLFLLWLRHFLTRTFWFKLWVYTAPWIICLLLFIPVHHVVILSLVLLSWGVLGLWGYYRFYPLFLIEFHLHKARFARIDELRDLLHTKPVSDGILIGTTKYTRRFLAVRPHKKHREIGNLLIVAPTRSGKGLLAISQLLSWKHSVIVNDMKGELFAATAGYRSTFGNVFVIDPTGVGHCYDPFYGKQTEDELFSAASQMLFDAEERERIFTERATVMLTQLFAAAKVEGIPSLPYVRHLVRSGLIEAATRLNAISPELATQFLDVDFSKVDFSDKFLHSAWSTLTAKIRPLLTETLVRCFTRSDFTAETVMRSGKPVTVYFRWKEEDLQHLSPLVRLLWGSLMNELITTYDKNQGQGCKPVLMLVDEAGRTAIPSLADQATTVVGRRVYLWVAIQSLSQLEVEYGKARAQVIRDNMESQIYLRPTDLSTAQYLELRCGDKSGFAKSTTSREGEVKSEGRAERPIPLITAQEIMQLRDEEVIGFHRRLPPFKMKRVEWWRYPILKQRRSIPPPQLPILPQIAAIPDISSGMHTTNGYIDPDMGVSDHLFFDPARPRRID